MYKGKITKWYGRNGNNLLQILNAIHLCKLKNINHFEICFHPIFELKKNIIFNYKDTPQFDKILLFNDQNLFKELSIDYYKQLADEFIRIKIDLGEEKITNMVSIHIRSGDIFNRINNIF